MYKNFHLTVPNPIANEIFVNNVLSSLESQCGHYWTVRTLELLLEVLI